MVGDDGLQLMQYELTIYCRRTAGFAWLAEWQYTRYAGAALEVFQAAADHDPGPLDLDITDLTNFLVAAMDGLVIQYEVTHDAQRCERDLHTIIRAATLLAGLPVTTARWTTGSPAAGDDPVRTRRPGCAGADRLRHDTRG